MNKLTHLLDIITSLYRCGYLLPSVLLLYLTAPSLQDLYSQPFYVFTLFFYMTHLKYFAFFLSDLRACLVLMTGLFLHERNVNAFLVAYAQPISISFF